MHKTYIHKQQYLHSVWRSSAGYPSSWSWLWLAHWAPFLGVRRSPWDWAPAINAHTHAHQQHEQMDDYDNMNNMNSIITTNNNNNTKPMAPLERLWPALIQDMMLNPSPVHFGLSPWRQWTSQKKHGITHTETEHTNKQTSGSCPSY